MEGAAMAVYRLFKNKAFEPDAIAAMSSAYADICRTVGLGDRDHSEADAVAKRSSSSRNGASATRAAYGKACCRRLRANCRACDPTRNRASKRAG
jgi:hypothetical protein